RRRCERRGRCRQGAHAGLGRQGPGERVAVGEGLTIAVIVGELHPRGEVVRAVNPAPVRVRSVARHRRRSFVPGSSEFQDGTLKRGGSAAPTAWWPVSRSSFRIAGRLVLAAQVKTPGATSISSVQKAS